MITILILSALGLFVLLAEIFRLRNVLFPMVIVGLVAAAAVAVYYWSHDVDGSAVSVLNGIVDAHHRIPSATEVATSHSFLRMIDFEDSSVILSVIILVTSILWFVMSKDFFSDKTNASDHYALVIFSLVGAIILTCYANMVMLFLGIEILSIPLYVLAGSRKNDLSSNEAAFKYFLMGAFASGFLLFGIALIYGATGFFDLRSIGYFLNTHAGEIPPFFYGGMLMLLVGLLFKISAAPFHFWAPDVYQGAPTSITAFMATVVKTGAIVAIMRLFLTVVFARVDTFWTPLIVVCSGLTLVIGNVTAVVQDKVKRMLAWSSISHAGFLLIAVAAFTKFSAKAIIYYVAAYSVSSITAFAVLICVMEQTGSDSIVSFNGLGKKNPLLAVAMTIALLSLAGIPPTAGFFGKYYILTAALADTRMSHVGLVILAILASLVGVYYYFRLIIAMYFKPAEDEKPIVAPVRQQALLFVTAVTILVLGLLPDLLIGIGTAYSATDSATVVSP